jgi:RND family efflux transporter MFP subunit
MLWVTAVGCSEPPPAESARSHAGADGLETVTAASAPVPKEILFDGIIEAVNEATVAAQTSGRVIELPYDVGDYVPKDAVIARLTDTEQSSRVEAYGATLAEAEARLKEATRDFERTQDIYERKLVARAELDRAAANRDSARARVESARAALQEAREQLGYTVIRAPYGGTVVARHVRLGETVAPGTVLLTGLSLEHLRAVVEVPQQHIAPLRVHHTARVVLADQSLAATDLRIPPKADPSTHTFRVLVTLPDGNTGVFPGTLVKVAFVSGEEQRLRVPARAVVRRGEITGVYVVKDGRVALRYLRTGTPTADGQVPVLAGLEAGEAVAVDPIAAGIALKSQHAAPAGSEE